MSVLLKWLATGWLLAGLGIALFVQQAAPALHGLPEVGIGEPGFDTGNVYISGKRFTCASLDASDALRCNLPLAGNTLEIDVRPNQFSDNFAGTCTAQFRGEIHSCEAGIHRGASRSIAVIRDGLGLNGAEREALRTAYPIENMGSDYPPLFLVYALVLSALVMGAVAFHEPMTRPLRRGAMVLPTGVATFIVTYLAWLQATLFLWN